MKTFTAIWSGQVLSLIGSGLTRFVLGIWVYQTSGSATLFALSLLYASLPQLVLLPVAGVFVDRRSRRAILIVVNIGGAALSIAVYALLVFGRLQIWHVWVVQALSAALAAFQLPAMSATTVSVVPRERLGRASGITEMGNAAALTLAPAMASALLVRMGMTTVLLLDVISFGPAILSLLLVTIPGVDATARSRRFWTDVGFGARYLLNHRDLLTIIGYVAALNCALNIAWILLTPLVLRVSGPIALGAISSGASAGTVLGGIALTAWGGPRRHASGVLGAGALLAGALVASSLRSSLAVIGVCFFLVLFAVPILNGCARTFAQERIPAGELGRVWSAIQFLVRLGLPLASVVSGPLADRVFEPLLAAPGTLLQPVGSLLGFGPGRGIAFIYLVVGAATLAVTAWIRYSAAARPLFAAITEPVAEPATVGAGNAVS